MRCPECGTQDTRVLATRTEPNGSTVTRTHLCGNDHRFSTLQMHESVVRGIGLKKVIEASGKHALGNQRRALAYSRKNKVARLLKQGVPVISIAAQVGITDARVRQLRTALAKNNHPTV